MRNFIEHDLVNYAKENPGIVVYIKPRRHRHPVIVAEYLNGDRQWMEVANYSRDDIIKWMELLRTQFHDGPSLRLRKLWHTEFPSIQGPWTPFIFRNPMLNLAQFPNVIVLFETIFFIFDMGSVCVCFLVDLNVQTNHIEDLTIV
ncbi:39S ribosomal protein L43, mitochondrial [Pogonomyrmex barbatus]|uniref:Large ribosomal subunit protein mL43 n=1 Tax=Pogonomyrmex barbatus TaxID=144034 RepID=A0A6I9WWI8_9HYME|nr:39S ribosomal protein L43, mitochondrial [Pogonomyrmex barbatus]